MSARVDPHLVPPRPPAGGLARAVLVDQLLGGLFGRLVALVASAGYGKTTLMVQALDQLAMPWAWCTVDDQSASGPALVALVALGLSRVFPGFGAGVLGAGLAPPQVSALAAEIEATIPDDIVLLLDDVHRLDGTGAEALSGMVTELPPNVHFVISSRAELKLPLGRLRLSGQVLEIGEEALVLSSDEARRMLEGAGLVVEPSRFEALYAESEGWAAGLLLGAQSPHRAARRSERAETFDYLAEEVIAGQSKPMHEFLLATAVPRRFSPALGKVLVPGAAVRQLLDDLLRQHLFVIRLEGEGDWFRYHGLFRAFLLRQLAERPADERAELHRRAGTGWLELGEPVEAVTHYLEARDYAAAAAALEPIAEELAASPEAAVLDGFLQALPENEIAGRPGLTMARARVLSGMGRFDEATLVLEQAIERLVGRGQHERAAAACLALIQTVGISGGDRAGIADRVRANLRRIEPGVALLPAAYLNLACVDSYANRRDLARQDVLIARELPGARARSVAAYADAVEAFWIDFPAGRLEHASQQLLRAIAVLSGGPSADPLSVRPFVRTWCVLVLIELGRLEQALIHARRIATDAEELGLGGLAAGFSAWALLQSLAALGNWDELGQTLVDAAPVFEGGLAPGQRHYYEAARAAAAAAAGDSALAEISIRSAAELVAANGCLFEEPQRLCDLVRVALAAGLNELASELAERAIQRASAAEGPWLRARAHLTRAAVLPRAERKPDIDEALSLTEKHQFASLWRTHHREQAPELLAHAIAEQLGPVGVADEILAGLGAAAAVRALESVPPADTTARRRIAGLVAEAADVPAEVLHALVKDADPDVQHTARRAQQARAARPRPALRIASLGDLRIWRAGVAVDQGPLSRPKVRALLAALLARDGASVHRDELLEWLWPDLTPERGRRSLHTTLGELRRGLDLEAAHRDGLVETRGETYRLQLSQRDEWDFATFRALAAVRSDDEAPADELARLLAAESLYAGPLFGEWPYDDWAIESRAKAVALHESLLARIADLLTREGRHAEAIARRRQLLAIDPEDEERHRDLMRAYAESGNRPLALRQFHACRTLLRERLSVEPSEETRTLYNALL